MQRIVVLFMLCVSVTGTICLASSPDAWNEFRQDVQIQCETKVEEILDDVEITIDPYGSESFGIAIAQGISRESKQMAIYICIYDKKTKRTEISSEFKWHDLVYKK